MFVEPLLQNSLWEARTMESRGGPVLCPTHRASVWSVGRTVKRRLDAGWTLDALFPTGPCQPSRRNTILSSSTIMELAASTASARCATGPLCTEAPGLTTADAHARLAQFGANAVREQPPHPLRQFLRRFWAPIPWLLEATIIIQMFLGERVEASVIAGLLVANAVLGLLQEGRAQKALALLRQQLRVEARVRRDGQWTTISAEELVPDDLVHLRQGVIVPADVRLCDGSLLIDQSALTGESAAMPVAPGNIAYAGALVRGGEATGVVTATGARTFFGKTAELVRTAHAANRQEHEIVRVVRDLFVLNAGLTVVVLGVAHLQGMTLGQTLPLVLTILLASIPVALPATFTLAAALGSVELSKFGVLVTRLSALHDIASMTVLCSDKTGTLTRNEATASALRPADGFSEEQLLRAAWLASDPAGQDPVDGAMVRAAAARGSDGQRRRSHRVQAVRSGRRNVPRPRIAKRMACTVTRKARPQSSPGSAACRNPCGWPRNRNWPHAASACWVWRQASRVPCVSRACAAWRMPCAKTLAPLSKPFRTPECAS